MSEFDHRTRHIHLGPVHLHASDPCNGWGERLPRVRSLRIGRWLIVAQAQRRRQV